MIKPARRCVMVETRKGTQRAILKRKPARFQEAVQQQARAVATGALGEGALRGELHAFVTPQRWAAVLSKNGRPPRGRKGAAARAALARELLDDALEDALQDPDRSARWHALTEAARARLR